MKKAVMRAAVVSTIAIATLALGSCGFILGAIFPNEFEVDGATFELSKLYVVNYGQNADGNYDIVVSIVSDGISVSSLGNWSGSGDEIWFLVNTSTAGLAEDTYSYNPNPEYIAGTFYFGEALVGYDYSSGTGQSIHPLNGGTVDIYRAAIGEDYIIDFEGTGTNGETIYSHFRGPLEISIIDASASALPASKTQ